MMPQNSSKPLATAVWDLPTRLFHWALVGLIGFSWWSAETGAMDWHRLSGLTVCGLIVFRLIWGVIGGSTARFASFVRAPQHVIAHLRGQGGERAGHNPLGGYSVIALLLLIALQVSTGLFAVDTDGLESGPLSYLVSFEQGRIASGVHEITFALLQVLVAVHIAAILFYRFVKRRNLVTPMITGRDSELTGSDGALIAAPWWRFALAAGVAAAFAWWTAGGMML
jgi:cytochrome b